MNRVSGIHIHIPVNSRKAPHILVLNVSAVTPAVHLESDQVFLAWFYILSNIKFSRQFTVLAIAHPLPVYPQIKTGTHGAKLDINIFSVPIFVHHYFPAVRTGRIILMWDI